MTPFTYRKVTGNIHIHGTGKPTNFKLGKGMEYHDLYHWHVQWPQRWKDKFITSCHHFYACLAHNTTKESHRNTNIGRKLYNSTKLKDQRSRSPGHLMPWHKISHIFQQERPTNFKLGTQMEYADPHHRNRQFEAYLPISRQMKVTKTPKLAGRLSAMGDIAHQVKCQRSRSEGG